MYSCVILILLGYFVRHLLSVELPTGNFHETDRWTSAFHAARRLRVRWLQNLV